MRHLITATRPFSWINTCLPFLATAIAAGHMNLAAVVLGAVYFLVPFNLLMYGLNDVYDYETDRNNPRKGGVEGAVLEPGSGLRLWLLVGATNLPLLIAAYPLSGVVPGLALTATATVAAAYSVPPVRTKVIAGLDSLTSSLHFTLPAVCGALLSGAPVAALPWRFLAALLLWGIASHALGAIQDVDFDRAAGIGSVATAVGARATAALSTIFYLAAMGLVAARGGPALVAVAALIPYVLLGFSCLGGEALQARRAWRSFMGQNLVSGFLVTQLLLHLWGLGPRDPLVLLAWTSGAGAWVWTLLCIAGRLVMRRRAPSASELPSLTVIAEGGAVAVATYPGPVEVLAVREAGRGAAAAAARGSVIAFLGAGTELGSGALAVLVEELRAQGGGIVGLATRPAGGTPWERSLALLRVGLAAVPRVGGVSALRAGGLGCVAVDARSHRLAGGGGDVAELAAAIALTGAPVRLLHGVDLGTTRAARGEVAARLRGSYDLHWCRASLPIALVGLLLPVAILLLPWALVVAGDVPALAGALWGSAAIVLFRVLAIRWERQPWTDLIWHPVSVAVIAWLQVLSIADGLATGQRPAGATSPEPTR